MYHRPRPEGPRSCLAPPGYQRVNASKAAGRRAIEEASKAAGRGTGIATGRAGRRATEEASKAAGRRATGRVIEGRNRRQSSKASDQDTEGIISSTQEVCIVAYVIKCASYLHYW